MGESIGKEKNIDGKDVHSGITPITSIGSTDLHSMGQLYLGGPDDKLTTFISTKMTNHTIRVPKKRLFPDFISGIDHLPMAKIMDAILRGVKIAYTKRVFPLLKQFLITYLLTLLENFFNGKCVK